MRRWTGAAVLALTLMFGGSAAIDPAAAAPLQTAVQKPQASKTTDISARRYYRHYYRYGYRPYYRPYYYGGLTITGPIRTMRPAPFAFGFGFGPWGW